MDRQREHRQTKGRTDRIDIQKGGKTKGQTDKSDNTVKSAYRQRQKHTQDRQTHKRMDGQKAAGQTKV